MRNWDAFQEDREFVLENLEEGKLDHLEVVSRVVETEFFRHFIGKGDLAKLAETYPTPREKEEVPLWLYLSAQITLRLHGAPGFSSLPYILHCGGLRDALEEGQVERKQDPETNRSYLNFKGYNQKNSYARRTPCDQDFVRKLARDTAPELLEVWYGTKIAPYFHSMGAYDPEGIFMIDGSYLFVPDNEHYEHSRLGYFDEHNHLISKEEQEKLSPAEKKRCRLRRYYQMVSLSHTNRQSEYLLYSGARVLRQGHEVKHLLPLVEGFVSSVGAGVMKTLLIDRGFIDGASIGKIKQNYDVDSVVPLKSNMTITKDAWRLATVDPGPWQVWEPPPKERPPDPPQRPERIRRAEKNRQRTVAEKKKAEGITPKPHLVRRELKVIPRMELWEECPVPLDVVVMREHMSDGTSSQWGLMTTRQVEDPLEIPELYHLRSSCEEGWRQGKCFWDLTGFRSPSFSLVVSQVIFVLLAYSLLQIFLVKSDRGELAKATRKRLLAELLPDGEKVAVYYENHVGYFTVMEYTHILLNLAEGARRRLAGTIKRLRKSQLAPPELPERPTM
jgi:hypothetical protein